MRGRVGTLSCGGWTSSNDTTEAKGMLLVNVQNLTGATPDLRMDVNVTRHPWKLPANTHRGKKWHKVLVRHRCLPVITGIRPAC